MQTLTKAERLRSRKTISLLFEKGKAISIHPVRMVWMQVANKEGSILQFGVAVPKKKKFQKSGRQEPAQTADARSGEKK
jgi:RNase P protein component